jgi:hypothetical protein
LAAKPSHAFFYKRSNSPGDCTLTRSDVAELIDRLLNHSGAAREWDDFVSIPHSDPEIERVRRYIVSLDREHPSGTGTDYLSPAGLRELRLLAERLRAGREWERE